MVTGVKGRVDSAIHRGHTSSQDKRPAVCRPVMWHAVEKESSAWPPSSSESARQHRLIGGEEAESARPSQMQGLEHVRIGGQPDGDQRRVRGDGHKRCDGATDVVEVLTQREHGDTTGETAQGLGVLRG